MDSPKKQSNQKKPKETKAENNKPKIQNKKKEEPKKSLKKLTTSNKNELQKGNKQCLNTIQNEHRKINTEYLGDKIKENIKGKEKKNSTYKKEKKKMLNNKIDNNDDDTFINRSMSFCIHYNKEKQISKKEEKPKEIKNATKITKKPLDKKKDKIVNKKSEEVEVVFNYNGHDTTIQIFSDEKMKDIINKFSEKTGTKTDSVFFIYNGSQININEDLSFSQQANEIDINRKKINILVSDINNNDEPKTYEIISKNFICPECYENIILDIKDYKINYKCKNNHSKQQIMFDEYENLQKMDLTKIKCGQCEKCTKGDTFNNEFFYCFDCKKNICPLCKNSHDQKHGLFNYDDKNYNCEKHNEQFIEYCQECEKNLCFLCKNEHINHKNIINLQNMIIPKEELLNKFKITEDIIGEIKKTVDEIKKKLDNFINIIGTLYKINKNFVDNYEVKNRNYEILQNLKEISNNN